MEKKQQQFSIWYFVAASAILIAIQYFLFAPQVEPIAYSEFKSLLKAGKLDNLAIGEREITGAIKKEGLEGILSKEKSEAIQKIPGLQGHFLVVRITDPDLLKELENSGIKYSGKNDNPWISNILSWVVPALVFFFLWSFLIRRMAGAAGGVMEIGKSKAKVYMEKETGVTFEDVAGIDEARQELMEVVEFLKNPQRFRKLGGKIPKGVLLVGAPGTGKTLLAKAVAGEAGVPFFSISGSEFVEMFVGVGAARVRDLFDQAQRLAPCIIFIDELDALGKSRGMNPIGGHDEREQTLNQLLVEMDGFNTEKGVIIMSATNRPEILDPALLRPGRFDRHVALDRPDLKGREKILAVHTKNLVMVPGIDLSKIAARTPGFVGADLANLANEAALLAARKDKTAVEMSDFDEAIERIIGGLEKKTRLMNLREKETVAYHEAGHALVAESRKNADKVTKVSIIPRGIGALGYTLQLPTEDRYLLKKSELQDRLDVLMGGRVAEEIIFRDISTGAQNDLQKATDMARHMVTQYGMSEQLGLATLEDPARSPFLTLPETSERRGYSEKTAQAIDEEVRHLLDEAQERVRDTLNRKREILVALAKLLLEKEMVDRIALDHLLSSFPET
ncbi:MAG: ATP-dependent zinc metalloprotease FtsH [Nitrospiria bacterium]